MYNMGNQPTLLWSVSLLPSWRQKSESHLSRGLHALSVDESKYVICHVCHKILYSFLQLCNKPKTRNWIIDSQTMYKSVISSRPIKMRGTSKQMEKVFHEYIFDKTTFTQSRKTWPKEKKNTFYFEHISKIGTEFNSELRFNLVPIESFLYKKKHEIPFPFFGMSWNFKIICHSSENLLFLKKKNEEYFFN